MLMKNQEKQVKIITATIVSIVVFLSLILIYQFVMLANLREKEKALIKQYETLQENIYKYNEENAYLQSPEFFEDYAREVLVWGKNGETKFK